MQQFNYLLSRRFFAQAAGGMEKLAERELKEFGAKDVKLAYRGVYFNADNRALYSINYGARLITRVLAPLITFDCHSDKYLYNQAYKFPWEELLSNNDTFAIFASLNNSRIKHSQYAGLKLKDAIVDRFRDKTGERPSINKDNPDIWLNLHIEENKATISFDTSGGSLHRRGYRLFTNEAPMQETVAAACIRLSGWHGERPLYDPMCGSGTLLAEAMLSYCQVPSAYKREKFGFMKLPDFDKALWEKIIYEKKAELKPYQDGLISGSDISPFVINKARQNLDNLPWGKNIKLEIADFNELEKLEDCTIITNPPYGIRLGKQTDMSDFYKSLGDFLKQKCKNCTAWVYVGNRDYIGTIGLKPSQKIPLKNAQLDGRLLEIKIY